MPNKMGQTLRVSVAIERIGRASVELRLHALRNGREVVRGRFVSVSTALDTHTVVPLPPDLRVAYETYQRRGVP